MSEVSYGGRVRDVAELAMELLEADRSFASEGRLFCGAQTLEDLKRMRRLAEASTLPDFVPEHWTVDGHRVPTAGALAQLALSIR